MTNTSLLNSKISESGYKLSYIAKQLGITSYALRMKIDNIHEFKASEIQMLCSVLKIKDLKEKNSIFFAMEVDKKSTR